MNRRALLSLLGAMFSGHALAGCRGKRAITGSIIGPSHDIGHLLRDGNIPDPGSESKLPIAIIGGGIAGLSAGWRLLRNGIQDFRIFELEPAPGGNSSYGQNSVSRYPWGAHYLPLPTKESRWVRLLLEELGVIEGYDALGTPLYDERYLCAAPQERLYIHGRWQDGLAPVLGASQTDLKEFARFTGLVDAYKKRRSADGRKAFAIPMDLSARDADLIALDRVSMAQFLASHGFESKRLHWYVNYACRDDFGCNYRDVSAWAGIHYFAGRDASQDDSVLTWPEGNGWIVRRLREKLAPHITPSTMAFRLQPRKDSVAIDLYDVKQKASTRVLAEHVVFACPTFLARFMLSEPGGILPHLNEFEYAPWLVANLTLNEFPAERTGVPLAWDNVFYDSESLGYVVATHQSLAVHQRQTVLTYYYALAGASPARDRKRLLETDWQNWTSYILTDLSRAHPEIREITANIDIMRWGHAMIRPRPGFIWGEARRRMTSGTGRIHYAHSDLSGFSLFEEAQYRGIAAAERIIEFAAQG